jgi:2'-5' RNA ligase
MSQKYVIVHFIDKTGLPDEFSSSQWPLHVTLLANFTTESVSELEQKLAAYAKETEPFTITADGEALFGPSKNVAVSLIQPNQHIVAMHKALASIASSLGAVYDEPAFMHDGYRPHATKQASARLSDGQVVLLSDFTLVDMYPDNDIRHRRIIKTFELERSQKLD